MVAFSWLLPVAVSTLVLAAPASESEPLQSRDTIGDIIDAAVSIASSFNICLRPAVRREWRTLSAQDKSDFINAVNCLSTKPTSGRLVPRFPRSDLPTPKANSSFRDDMTYIHYDLTSIIHYTGYFLPWHRWYTNQLQVELTKQCGYRKPIPYWNWSLDVADLSKAPVYDADPVTGLGTDGDPSQDYTVTNGGLKDITYAYPSGRRLRRQYNLYPYKTWFWLSRPNEAANVTMTQAYVDALIATKAGDYETFQAEMEKAQAMHANVHILVGGDLAGTCPSNATDCTPGSTFTPNDILFFLHHANLDRIWAKWQSKDIRNALAFSGGSVGNYSDLANPTGYAPYLNLLSKIPASGLWPEVPVLSVISTVAGSLCYKYE